MVRDRHKRLHPNLSRAERHRCGQSDGAGHERTLKPGGQCLAAAQAASRARAEYQKAIGGDRCITSEGKAATSCFLLTNPLSYWVLSNPSANRNSEQLSNSPRTQRCKTQKSPPSPLAGKANPQSRTLQAERGAASSAEPLQYHRLVPPSPSLPGLAPPSATALGISGNLAVFWEKIILTMGEDWVVRTAHISLPQLRSQLRGF